MTFNHTFNFGIFQTVEIGTFTKKQAHCTQNNGFSRAGLTRNHSQSLLQVHPKVFNKGIILYGKCSNHRQSIFGKAKLRNEARKSEFNLFPIASFSRCHSVQIFYKFYNINLWTSAKDGLNFIAFGIKESTDNKGIRTSVVDSF